MTNAFLSELNRVGVRAEMLRDSTGKVKELL